MIFADIESTIAALRAKHRHLSILRPTVDRIVVWIAEEEVPRYVGRRRHPHRSFDEEKPARKFFEPGAGRNDPIERRIDFLNLRRNKLRMTDLIRFIEI